MNTLKSVFQGKVSYFSTAEVKISLKRIRRINKKIKIRHCHI